MNFTEYCTPMEIASINSTLTSIRDLFLKAVPSDIAENILVQNYSGSYSKLYWYLTEMAEQTRPLTLKDISQIRNLAGYVALNQTAKSGLQSHNATMMILVDLVKRPSRESNRVPIPVLVAKAK